MQQYTDAKDMKRLVAEKIQARLDEMNLTRIEFARMCDVPPSTVTRWLKGDHNFTISTIYSIEWVLQINILNYQNNE